MYFGRAWQELVAINKTKECEVLSLNLKADKATKGQVAFETASEVYDDDAQE